jgi:hypothetical protein
MQIKPAQFAPGSDDDLKEGDLFLMPWEKGHLLCVTCRMATDAMILVISALDCPFDPTPALFSWSALSPGKVLRVPEAWIEPSGSAAGLAPMPSGNAKHGDLIFDEEGAKLYIKPQGGRALTCELASGVVGSPRGTHQVYSNWRICLPGSPERPLVLFENPA